MTVEGSVIFGPVLSRRLGLSLGLDIVPFKTCSLDCLYCQLGPGDPVGLERRPYLRTKELLSALARRLGPNPEIDWITFSGSGEPTLNSELGAMIKGVKSLSPIPVAVITNSTLLDRPGVREEIGAADLVVPSLDAGTEAVFKKINRPRPGLDLDRLTGGVAALVEEGACRVWLEVMLADGINDDERELGAIAERIKAIGPELVQLNTPVRPPAEAAGPLSPERLEDAAAFLAAGLGSIPVEVIGPGRRGKSGGRTTPSFDAVADYLRRRPATLEELAAAAGGDRAEILKHLSVLTASGRAVVRYEGKKRYFAWRRPGSTRT